MKSVRSDKVGIQCFFTVCRVLASAMAPATCDACGKGTCKLFRCGRCRNAWFCGRECQIIAARQGHSGANCRPTDGARTFTAAEAAPRVPDAAGPSTTAVDSTSLAPAASCATHVARTTPSCCAAVGAGACGFATASVRSPPQGRATPAPTAAPPTERRDLLPWRTRGRPLQLSHDPPRQLTSQVCASASLIC